MSRASHERKLPGFVRQVSIVARKELRLEAESGEVTVSSGFFAVLVVVLASMSFHGGPRTGKLVAAGVIWLSVVFAAVLSLGRSWARERQHAALAGLLVTPLSPAALFVGKALALGLFLLVIELLVLPIAALFFSLELVSVLPGLLAILPLATLGIATAGTLFGAMTVRTSARDLALAVVLLPLLAPAALTAIAATRTLFEGQDVSAIVGHLRLLGIFALAFTAAGIALFGTLIED